jgi:hypothetical protein
MVNVVHPHVLVPAKEVDNILRDTLHDGALSGHGVAHCRHKRRPDRWYLLYTMESLPLILQANRAYQSSALLRAGCELIDTVLDFAPLFW